MNIKEKMNKLINELDDNSNWDDVMYKIYVIKSIEESLEQVKNNKLVDFNIVKEQFNADKVY